MNDADIEMAELTAAANMAYNGVCPLCEDMLDPTDPKWASEFPGGTWRGKGALTPELYADIVGPVSDIGGYHDRCLNREDAYDSWN